MSEIQTPVISIITVCYNSAKTIRQTIESVLAQSYKNIEYLIIDGNSKDDTLSIIREYESKFTGTGISYKWFSEPDKGLYDAMNKGLKLVSGDWVGIINSDDFYINEKVIAAIAAKINEEPKALTLYSDLYYVAAEDDSKIVRYWKAGKYTPRSFYFGWMPPHPTFFVKRDVYAQVGLFNLSLKSAADYEIMLRILVKYMVPATYLPLVTVKMRTGGVSNANLQNRLSANRQDRLAWRINDLKPYWFTLLLKPLRKIFQYVIK